jgi:hypothetical protein
MTTKFIPTTAEHRALGLGLFLRTGATDAQLETAIKRDAGTRAAGKWEPVAEQAFKFRDRSLLEIAHEAAKLDKADVGYNREDTMRAAVSGGSLTNIFTTSVNAYMMAAWDDEVDTTLFCQERDVQNFKNIDVIDFMPGSDLNKQARGGTAQHAKPQDTKETYKIARYTKQFIVDEQDLIDDNISALTDMPRAFGRAAKRLRPDLVYSIMLANAALNADGVALFHATHNNLLTGAGSALQASAMKTALSQMQKQTYDGHAINVRGRYVIVPPELKWTALELTNSTQILIAGTAGTVTERGSANVLQSENLNVVSEGRVSDTGVVDPDSGARRTGTTTNWFLAGDQRTIEVAYRMGTNRMPVVRGYALTQGQWGFGWDISHDIGAKAIDYRGVLKSNGV